MSFTDLHLGMQGYFSLIVQATFSLDSKKSRAYSLAKALPEQEPKRISFPQVFPIFSVSSSGDHCASFFSIKKITSCMCLILFMVICLS